MEPDTVELARFREQWRAEVRSRRSAFIDTAAHALDPAHVHPAVLAATHKLPEAVPSGRVHENTVVPSQNLLSALQAYREAIHREQNGELEDALLLYRQAFRMVFLIHPEQLWIL